ncbi:MAG: ABC transporter permease [Microterricola sp.]
MSRTTATRATPLARVLALRILGTLALLIVLSMLIFLLLYLAPGDLVKNLLGIRNTSPEMIAQVRAQYGLDLPLHEQYLAWLGGVVSGDFGTSIRNQTPVGALLLDRLGVTLLLSGLAFALAVVVAVPLGAASAFRQGGALDRGISGFSILGLSAPSFAVGLLLLYVFAVALRWFPIYGVGDGLADTLWHLMLPAATIAIGLGAILVKLTRTATLRELTSDYVTFARARGLTRAQVVRLVLRNAAIPVVTGAGLVLTFMVGSTVLVETVFALPGVGMLLQESVLFKDVPVVQALTLAIAAVIAVIALAVDLLYLLLDPRVRHRELAS